MKKIITTILLVVAVPLLILFLVNYAGKGILGSMLGENTNTKISNNSSLEEKLLNKKVPFFDLPTIDSSRIKLSQYEGKPFVLVFWTTWNVESVNQLKILDGYINLPENKKNKLVSFITINSQEEESIVKSFLRRGGYEVSNAQDSSGSVGESFNIKSFPTSFFVDKDGLIRDIYTGVMSEKMFVDKVEQLLK